MKRVLFGAIFLSAIAGCDDKKPAPAGAESSAAVTVMSAKKPAAELDTAQVKTLFKQLPKEMTSKKNPITAEKVSLGRMLYFEKRLSKNHDISCNSCHDVNKFGVDNEPTSPGHKAQRGARNSPSSFNAAGHIAQFWDGRAADVEEQAKGPVLNPVEMAMKDEAAVLATLKSMPEYVDAFKKAFPDDKDAVTYDNFAKAVGAFERKLVTPSRFDKFLGGDDKALTDEEKNGLAVFMKTGCTTCHAGPYLGGHIYQKLGVVKPWPNLKDEGRKEHTKQDADKYMFKVPSLLNIAKTGPYLHDGSVKELDKMVQMMAKYQLGKDLSDADTKAIVTFLNALTGEVDKEYVKAPELPKSTAKTPKPDPA